MQKEDIIIKKAPIEIKIPQEFPYSDSQYVGVWHQTFTVPIVTKSHSHSLRIAGMITGCGIGQCYGLAGLGIFFDDEELTPRLMQEALKQVRANGIGAIIGTLGETYYKSNVKFLKVLEKIEFKEVAEYNNWAHGTNYMQKAFILKLHKTII